ncbi:MAG: tyrosine-type recombinase/integrase [Acidimicrobiales bacterium]
MKGHLRRRGSAWELRAYAGIDPLTGRQTYVTRTFRGGKREADEALARLVTEVSGGGHAAQDTTVGHLIEQWLDLAQGDLSPTTARGYRWIVKTYILPTLGKVPLARLRTAQLDRFYAQLREAGGQDGKPLSAATVRQVHAIVRRALQQGVRWGWIATNPASLASPPRVKAPQLAPPDPDAVIRLIEQAAAADPDFGCFLHLAATTGARRGELCALRWRDLDLEAGAVTITRSVVEAAHSVVVEKDTKTHASRRIALDPGTVVIVKAHRDRMASRVESCGGRLADDAHVFSHEVDGSRPWAPNDVTKVFIRVRNRAGLGTVRLHDLRHFAATRLLAAGVSVRTVSGRLGHANAATTLGVYAHFVEESDREAAGKLGALVVRSAVPEMGSQELAGAAPL